ncbi:MAG: TOBE-like domain-containing protein, partial [Elainella sp.]
MGFIGPVNVLPSTAPIFRQVGYQPESNQVFLRPHDVLVALEPDGETVPAVVLRVVHLGWEIQVEVALEDGQSFTINLSREQFNDLQLYPRQQVYVKPKSAKSFTAQSA